MGNLNPRFVMNSFMKIPPSRPASRDRLCPLAHTHCALFSAAAAGRSIDLNVVPGLSAGEREELSRRGLDSMFRTGARVRTSSRPRLTDWIPKVLYTSSFFLCRLFLYLLSYFPRFSLFLPAVYLATMARGSGQLEG